MSDSPNHPDAESTPPDPASIDAGNPSYSKPTIRKYNQIVQVRPYGPSEKEAG